jgi:hypothetical protein
LASDSVMRVLHTMLAGAPTYSSGPTLHDLVPN